MPTDVSSFKDAYKTAIKSDFPQRAELVIGDKRFPMKAVQYLEADQSTITEEQEYAERRTKMLAALAKMEVV